jgi:hypothetical protein
MSAKMNPKVLAETLSSLIEDITPAQLKLMPKQDIIQLGMLQNMLSILMLQTEMLDDLTKKLGSNEEAKPIAKIGKITIVPKAP